MSSSSRMMATRQPIRMAVGLPSALATGCWPLGSSSGRGRRVRTTGGFPPKQRGAQEGPTAQDPHNPGEAQGCSPKLLKLVGGGPGGHQGAGAKVPPRAREESFTTSGTKEETKGGNQLGWGDQREAHWHET